MARSSDCISIIIVMIAITHLSIRDVQYDFFESIAIGKRAGVQDDQYHLGSRHWLCEGRSTKILK